MKEQVVIYLRLSEDDGDGESMSISNQRKTLYEYASKNNMEIIEEFVDDGVSGYLWSRPSFNRLKRDLNNNKVNTILVKDLSKFCA
jgi:DNA invertase Pin-like site-specific DNA recombinase